MTGGAPEICAPEHLTAAHDVSAFDSGVPDLDDWLRSAPWRMRTPGRRGPTWSAPGGGWWGITRWPAAVWRTCRRRAASGGICRIRCR